MAGLPLVLLVLLYGGCAGVPPPEEGLLPLPTDIQELQWRRIAPGVEYKTHPGNREVPQLHLLRVDLENEKVKVSPYPPQESGAEPLHIAETAEASVVISATPFRYVLNLLQGFQMEPVGVYKADGVLYSQQEKEWGVLWKEPSGELKISDGLTPSLLERAYWAAGGFEPILLRGQNIGVHGERTARTAVGLDAEARFFYIVVVEGEGPLRRGLTSKETSRIFTLLGASSAMNFDGGNSAFLVIKKGEGDAFYAYRGGRRSMVCFLLVK
ncbi:MAG: phosphodiester glycosidase family protein [Spirochaetia bacterium]|nr:phosphodiester glycosidase family protein [Spirochaetia bacterium]